MRLLLFLFTNLLVVTTIALVVGLLTTPVPPDSQVQRRWPERWNGWSSPAAWWTAATAAR